MRLLNRISEKDCTRLRKKVSQPSTLQLVTAHLPHNEGEKTAHQDLKNDEFEDQTEREREGERRGEGDREREILLFGQYLSHRVSLESRVREGKREERRERDE